MKSLLCDGRRLRGSRTSFAAIFLLLAGMVAAIAQGTAFTYSGRLTQVGGPADGLYDLQFALLDAPVNGAHQGPALTNPAVTLNGGRFQTLLDFGADVFAGAPRWLEIGVRTNGSMDPYTLLQPRQAITAAPYSIFAGRAATAAQAARLSDGGATLTALPADRLVGLIPPANLAGITSAQIAAATDAAYRAGVSNRVTVINVRDYGAVGDGMTDDTDAIANAWSQFMAVGGTLYFPPGTYLDSGTHTTENFVAGEPTNRDGRLILGLGSVIWVYTGHSRLLYLHNTTPDIDGFEFRCYTGATNCAYISNCQGKCAVRNCFFEGWDQTTLGTLVLDEADSVTLGNDYFDHCKVGLGLGFRCSNLHGDIETVRCGLGVAVGVLTDQFPTQGESRGIDLNLTALYCATSFACDSAAASVTLRGYFWNSSNAVVLGRLPGILTNNFVSSLTLDHCFFHVAPQYSSPVQIFTAMTSLDIRGCFFYSYPGAPALMKSQNVYGDAAGINYENSVVWNLTTPVPVFEDSSGRQINEGSPLQAQSLNRTLGIYNWTRQVGMGGSGYLLDVQDAGLNGPIARMGVPPQGNSALNGFGGGLVVSYDPALGTSAVGVTNADLVLRPPTAVTSATTSGSTGTVRWDADYLYICVGTNTWKRAPLSAW